MQFEIVICVQAPEIVSILTAINDNLTALVAQGSQDAVEEAAAQSINSAVGKLTASLPASAG